MSDCECMCGYALREPCGLTRDELHALLKTAEYDPGKAGYQAYFEHLVCTNGQRKHHCTECMQTIGKHGQSWAASPSGVREQMSQLPLPRTENPLYQAMIREELEKQYDCWDRHSRDTPTEIRINFRQHLQDVYPGVECVVMEQYFNASWLHTHSMSVGAHILPRFTTDPALYAMLHLQSSDDLSNGIVMCKTLEIQFDWKNWCLYPMGDKCTYRVHIFGYEQEEFTAEGKTYNFKKKAGVTICCDASLRMVKVEKVTNIKGETTGHVPRYTDTGKTWKRLEGIKVVLPSVSMSALLYHAFRCALKHGQQKQLLDVLSHDHIAWPHPQTCKESHVANMITPYVREWLEGTPVPPTTVTAPMSTPVLQSAQAPTHVTKAASPPTGHCQQCGKGIPAIFEFCQLHAKKKSHSQKK